MNILFVGAHHDDLEISVGGSVKKWIVEGNKVYCAILTNSTWNGPDGKKFRDEAQVLRCCNKAADILGYEPINLNYSCCFELSYSDDKVVDIINIIEKKKIDMLVTIWPHDAHKDHRVVSEIAIAATRNVPRVLLTKISWNSSHMAFKPTFFVDIGQTFEDKRRSLQCYEDEYERRCQSWEKYMLTQAHMYGLEAGCEMAEGFEVLKYLY